MQQFTAASLLEKLSAAAAEAERESDELAKKFVSDPKTLSPNDFVTQFLDKRKEYHLRLAKVKTSPLLSELVFDQREFQHQAPIS